ncbi:MAG: hypothetical protein ACRC41_10795 [Sarcina sp.]
MKALKIIITLVILIILTVSYLMRVWVFNIEKIFLLIPVYIIYIAAPLLVMIKVVSTKKK